MMTGSTRNIATLARHITRLASVLILVLAGCWNVTSAQGQATGIQDQDMLRALQFIETQIDQASESIQQLANRVPPVEKEVRELTDRLLALDSPSEKESSKEPEAGRREITYRLPKVSVSDRSTPIFLIFQDNRVTILGDATFDERSQHFQALITEIKSSHIKKKTWEGELQVTDGHFDLKYDCSLSGILLSGKYVAVRKSGSEHRGETASEIRDSSSALKRAMLKAKPKDTTVQCVVYPDSFELFRIVRASVWEIDKNFEFSLNPFRSGQPVSLGSGTRTGD